MAANPWCTIGRELTGWDEDNPDYVREALNRERAVLLEKPGAPDPPALYALLAEARAAPVPFQVGYMLACSPAVAHARDLLDSGALGPLSLARFHAPGPVGSTHEPCLSRPGDLGGVVYGDGAHVVHLIVHLLGAPRRVSATLLRLPPGPPVLAQDLITGTLTQETTEVPFGGTPHEDAGAAVLEYPDKLVTFDMTAWGAHPWVEAWTVELCGVEGTLHLGLQPPWYRYYLRRQRAGFQAGWHTWEGKGVTGTANSLVADADYRDELQQVLARVRVWDTKNEPWIAEAEAVGAVLEAIFRSHRTGAAVSVARSDGAPWVQDGQSRAPGSDGPAQATECLTQTRRTETAP